jgi:hypothetical protein
VINEFIYLRFADDEGGRQRNRLPRYADESAIVETAVVDFERPAPRASFARLHFDTANETKIADVDHVRLASERV